MRILGVVLIVLQGLSLYSRDTIDQKFVEQYTTNFTLHQGNLDGKGAMPLIEAIEASQFFLIGEMHGNQQISFLTEALIGEMDKAGYKHFVIETGPFSAEILERELMGSENTMGDLSSLYQRYYHQTRDIPIPFFEGKSDAVFLDKALSSGMKLVGIDQEYYSSALMLIDEMEHESGSQQWEDLFAEAKKEVIRLQLIDAEDDNFDIHQALLDNQDVQALITSAQKAGGRVGEIADALMSTWRIYAAYGKDMNYNLNTRAAYMKSNFSEYYNGLSEDDKEAGFLIKMGSLHTERGLTYNAVYDIGTVVSSLAELNGTRSTHLTFLTRYFYDNEEGEEYDNSEGGSQWLKEHNPFILQGKREEWALIDLKSLRADIINRKVWVYPGIRRIAFKHDFMLIPPLSRDIIPHYTEDR